MALLLLNRQAGGGRATALEPVLRSALACASLGATHPAAAPSTTATTAITATAHSLATPDSVAEAEARVLALPPGSRVVLVGGDGSVHRLLPALLARQCSLGLVPAGSGDDIARALGLQGLTVQAALQLALTGVSRPWDVGEVKTPHQQRPFLSSLCMGFDAAVAARAAELPSWLGGRHRYTLATLLQLLRLRLHQATLCIDGAAGPAGPWLMTPVLNTPTYGGGLPAVPAALPDDGRLNLLHAGRFSRLAALRMLPALMQGRHLGHAQVGTRSFTRLHVQASEPLPLAADGEALHAATTVQVRVLPAALQVVCHPAASSGSV